MNIHFICRGNVLRSLVAETYLKSLNLKNLNIISSGTNVNWEDEREKRYFANTLELLERHDIKKYAKDLPNQLTQARANNEDVTICMNQRVGNEADAIVKLPKGVISWDIVDIGEGHRIIEADTEFYQEEIYQEITNKVDGLVKSHHLS